MPLILNFYFFFRKKDITLLIMIIQFQFLLTILLLISPSVFSATFTSGLIGDSDGYPFNISTSNQIQQVVVTYDIGTYGNGLNSILLQFTNSYQSSVYGSLSGSVSLYSPQTSIIKIIVCIGGETVPAYIYSIQFFTKGKQSPVYGCPYNAQIDTTCYSVGTPGGLVGIQGYADGIVYGLNFVSNKAISIVPSPTTTTSTTTTTTTTKPFTGALLYTLTGHTDIIFKIVTLTNGNLASGSKDNTVKIWNPKTGALVYTLTVNLLFTH
jgi:WD40 repeat protein